MKLVQLQCPTCGKVLNAKLEYTNAQNLHFLNCEYCGNWYVCENETPRVLSEFEKYLTSGIANIKTNHLDWAKAQFYEYAKWNPMDFRGWLGMWIVEQQLARGTNQPQTYADDLMRVASGDIRKALGDLSFQNPKNNEYLANERARLVSEIQNLQSQSDSFMSKEEVEQYCNSTLSRDLQNIEEDYERAVASAKGNWTKNYYENALKEEKHNLRNLRMKDWLLAFGTIVLLFVFLGIMRDQLGDGGAAIKIVCIGVAIWLFYRIAKKSKNNREDYQVIRNTIRNYKDQVRTGKKEIKRDLASAWEFRGERIERAKEYSKSQCQAMLSDIKKKREESNAGREQQINQRLQRIAVIDDFWKHRVNAKNFEYYFSLLKS